MAQSHPTFDIPIEYADDDPIVRRCLEKSALYRKVGWAQLGMLVFIALLAIVEDSVGWVGNHGGHDGHVLSLLLDC